jgi:hypothetical protein
MQCSDSFDEEFGWDCMLGKLCRLAKRGQRASTLDAKATRPLQLANQNSTGTTMNYILHPSSEWGELQRNNSHSPHDALRQHTSEKL